MRFPWTLCYFTFCYFWLSELQSRITLLMFIQKNKLIPQTIFSVNKCNMTLVLSFSRPFQRSIRKSWHSMFLCRKKKTQNPAKYFPPRFTIFYIWNESKKTAPVNIKFKFQEQVFFEAPLRLLIKRYLC